MKLLIAVIAFAAGLGVAALYFELRLLPWGQEFFYLVIAGGFGGLAQALFTGNDKLRLPAIRTSAEGRGWDAGFVADCFIGMLGATVSMLFALAMLSDRFFGVVDSTKPEVSVPSWVRVIAFGALSGFAARQLLPSLSKRLKDVIEKTIDDKTKDLGAEVERQMVPQIDEIARSHTEIARLNAVVAPPPQAVALAAAGGANLETLVREYMNINEPDKDARIAARMRIADAMLPQMVAHNTTTASLYDRLRNGAAKEYVLPLATLIAAQPGPEDATRLFDVVEQRLGTPAIKSESKFVLYRVLLAIISLNENRQLGPQQVPRAKKVARDCQAIDDASLQRKASAVLALLNS